LRGVRVPSQTFSGSLSVERLDAINALKMLREPSQCAEDVEGSEDVILHSFFREAPPRMWPRLIIIEDSRASWKVDLMSILMAKGIAVNSKQNFILRRVPNRDTDCGSISTTSQAGMDVRREAG